MTAAVLLAQSRAAHDDYRRCAAKGRKPDGWQAHLWDALTCREQAHALDPHHTDPAWSDDTVSHAELVAFYRKQLGVPA